MLHGRMRQKVQLRRPARRRPRLAIKPPIEQDRSALSGSKLGYGVQAQFIGSKSQAFL